MWESKLLMTNAIQPAGVLVDEKPPHAALEAPPQNAFFPTDLNYPPPPDLPAQEYVSVSMSSSLLSACLPSSLNLGWSPAALIA